MLTYLSIYFHLMTPPNLPLITYTHTHIHTHTRTYTHTHTHTRTLIVTDRHSHTNRGSYIQPLTCKEPQTHRHTETQTNLDPGVWENF